MFDILKGIVEHIMLFFNIPDRPFLTALVKAIVITVTTFIVMRFARFFFESIKTSLIIGCRLAMLMLDLFEKNKIEFTDGFLKYRR